jgi:uncharacterized protein (TIGR02266 family)
VIPFEASKAGSDDEMVQDTRKDPRAKVLTMTVRYKSATIDEFIEHHSHDISRGGIFIKTPSPFPPGTLLKFEIRIAEDKSILGGVGRVVWKRDDAQASNDLPAGMGVKFLKIDDSSRQVIDQIVAAKGDLLSAFDDNSGDSADDANPATESATTPVETGSAHVARVALSNKATMLGLGAMAPPVNTPSPATDNRKAASDEGTFFPKTEVEKELPPPEERTVMKQAAELLAEALKGAGGSMEEIGPPPEAASRPAEPAPKPAPVEPAAPKKAEPNPAPSAPKRVAEPARARQDSEPPTAAKRNAEPKRISSAPPAARAPVEAKPPAPHRSEDEADSGGSTTVLAAVAVVLLLAGGAYWWYTTQMPAASAPEPSIDVTMPPPPPPAIESAPEATAEPDAAAPAAQLGADAATKVEQGVAPPKPSATTEPAATTPPRRPPATPRPKPPATPRPKPPAATPPEPPAATPPEPPAATPPEPPAATPPEPPATTPPKPPATTPPKPPTGRSSKPAANPASGDNPY